MARRNSFRPSRRGISSTRTPAWQRAEVPEVLRGLVDIPAPRNSPETSPTTLPVDGAAALAVSEPPPWD